MGNSRPEQKSSLALLRSKHQVRELHQRMTHSMTRSFPSEVWNACEIPHPEGDVVEDDYSLTEKEQAKVSKATKAEEVNKKFIKHDREPSMQRDYMQEQRQFAHLAQQSGWSVLDVEEFHGIFCEYATDGTICLASEACTDLFGRLYTGAKKPEIASFVLTQRRHSAVRKPEDKVHHRKRATVGHNHHRHTRLAALRARDAQEDQEPDQTMMDFETFYFAFVRWMRQTGSRDKTNRCTLKRFASKAPDLPMGSIDSESSSEDEDPNRPADDSESSGSEVHSIGGSSETTPDSDTGDEGDENNELTLLPSQLCPSIRTSAMAPPFAEPPDVVKRFSHLGRPTADDIYMTAGNTPHHYLQHSGTAELRLDFLGNEVENSADDSWQMPPSVQVQDLDTSSWHTMPAFF